MKLFSFDPYRSEVNIRLATEYQPKILKNKIPYRPYNGILYILSGSYRYTFSDGTTATANEGDLIYLPRGSAPYSYEIFSSGMPLRTAQVEFEVKSDGELLSFADRATVCSCISKTEAEDAIKGVISAFTSSKPSSLFLSMSNLYRLLAIFESDSEATSASTGAAAIISPAVAFLEQHYAQQINSEQLASLCHISTSQLRRNFNDVFGMSPMQYKRSVIFTVSKRLLRTGDFKIGEIADMLGFNDIYQFSHFFVKMAGISPREYQSNDK